MVNTAAAEVGETGLLSAGAAAGIAKILFFGFLVVAAIALVVNLTRGTI